MSKFGRKLAVFILSLCLLLSLSSVAMAAEDRIDSIDVTAKLYENGSASITETWSITNVYSGTEYYIPIYNAENMTVSNLSVTDEDGNEFQYMNTWDTSLSFEEKAYRCGILKTNDGYEICWGISQYGNKNYTISYDVTGLVKSYTDKDGFYYQFITDNLSSPPDSVNVLIYMDGVSFSESNAQIWAMGFEGEVWFENGGIVAYSTEELSSDDYVNVLCGFKKGLFAGPAVNKSFEEVKKEAQDEVGLVEILLIIAAIFTLVIVIFVIIHFAYRNIKLSDGSKVRRLSEKETQKVGAIPFYGSIQMTYAAMLMRPSYNVVPCSPIAAFLIRWEMEGIISYDNDPDNQLQLIEEGDPLLSFTGKVPSDKREQQLLNMFTNAANSSAANSSTLTLSKWKKWVKKHSEEIVEWQDSLKKDGEDMLISHGWAGEHMKGKVAFTYSGFEMASGMMGFYKYLKTFNEKNSDINVEREYWGDYLVFASLFNLAESVVTGLNDTYHDEFYAFTYGYGMNNIMLINYMSYGSSFSNTASVHTSDGSGGASFSGGGGGFSGGGGGGGSR